MKARYILAGLCAAVVVGNSPAIIAEAHAGTSARCKAHIAEHGTTPGADRRYHLEHHEFSPCTEQDAGESKHRDEHRDKEIHQPHVGGDDHKDHDKKSRYCRKHWFC